MPTTRLTLRRALAVASVAVLAACGRDERAADAGVDSAFQRDLALAGADTALAPTFADTALGGAPAPAPTPRPQRAPRPTPAPARREREQPRPAPARTRPAPAPVVARTPEPEPAPAEAPAPTSGRNRGQFAAGTGIDVSTGAKVCTASGRPGDKIVGTVSADVVGADGAVIPAGSKAVLEVAEVRTGSTPDRTTLVFRVRTLDVAGDSYSVVGRADASDGLQRQRVEGSTSSDKKKVIGGAIAGAILGQMIGKDTKGTIIGAAAGAAAGTGAAMATAKYEGCLPAGATVRVVLQEPVSVAIR